MTREAHLPGLCPASDETVARIRATVYGPQFSELARIANFCALDCPAGRFGGADLEPGTVAWTFVPGDTPAGRYLRVTVRLVPGSGVATTGTVTLTVTDGTATLTGAVPEIPLGFRGETVTASASVVGSRFDFATVIVGDFDLAAMAATLTGPTWSWSFTTTLGGTDSTVSIQAEELPRGVVDTAETYGALPAAYLGGAEIDDDSALGTERILTTLAGARTTQPVYLSRAWPQDTASAPSLTATSWAPLTSWDEGGSAPETTRVLVRRLAAASAQGEPIRYRVLYRLSGGAGTETADVRLSTGSSASPFALGSLAHTGTSWAWSDWKAGHLKTDEATAGQEQTDTLGLEGQLSASGPTLYLAGIDVRGAAT